ncbi:acyl carrier protein [Paenibacillus sp. KN14-4R]|uniref:acyl carrier protein n=1 Tax=Paenibacillus sp. KN14-4R TaxID=3445773 RepID=UPI003F9F9D95
MTVPEVMLLEKYVLKILNEILSKEILIGNNEDLWNEGLDSVNTIRLIGALEIEFKIEIDDQDLLIENFSTIERILNLLSKKVELSSLET